MRNGTKQKIEVRREGGTKQWKQDGYDDSDKNMSKL